MKYTIVGGGAAAFTALKKIREYDSDCHITVVSGEKHCFYYRPMTPLVVKGDRERDELMHDKEVFGDIRLIHDLADSLDAENRRINLKSGEVVEYDRLLIATGSSPVIPEIPGVRQSNVYYLRTLEDAQKLRDIAGTTKSAVVLGGGFVGIKKATALAHHGVRVTVVEKEKNILLPRLDEQGASILAEKVMQAGITLIMEDTVSEILPEGRGARLASGRELEADIVCVAAGVRPNTAWLQGSGIEQGQAIIVDDRMQTSIPGVYAAGDVVQTTDLVSGRTIVSGLWSNAVEMGKSAGINMAGGKLKYAGGLEVMNATEIEGLPMVSVGNVLAEEDDHEIVRWQRNGTYRKLAFKDNTLAGAIFMGDINNAGIYTSLIKTQKPLGLLKEKMLSRTISYIDFLSSH